MARRFVFSAPNAWLSLFTGLVVGFGYYYRNDW